MAETILKPGAQAVLKWQKILEDGRSCSKMTKSVRNYFKMAETL